MVINFSKNRLKGSRNTAPREILVVAKKLEFYFQPNYRSSFYQRPSKTKIPIDQKTWNSPAGTLRMSDHWNYENYQGRMVYQTPGMVVPQGLWAIAVNNGLYWQILHIFEKEKNLINKTCFKTIKEEIVLERKKILS